MDALLKTIRKMAEVDEPHEGPDDAGLYVLTLALLRMAEVQAILNEPAEITTGI